MSTQASIIGAFIIGAIIIGLRYWIAPESADAGALQIGGLTLAVMAILAKLGETKNAADAAKVEAVKSTAASKENAQSIAAVVDTVGTVSGQVDENTAITNTTHDIVNSRMDEFKQALKDIADMKIALVSASAELATAKAELATANEVARAIMLGREQVTTTIADERNAVAHAAPAVASGDTTITGPVTIKPLGDTTIVMPEKQP